MPGDKLRISIVCNTNYLNFKRNREEVLIRLKRVQEEMNAISQ